MRHDHRRHRLRGFGYFRGLGPGLVTGAADDDPSGIGTYAQVGAQLRFDLLWTAVVSLPLAAAVVELASRLGLVEHRGLAAIVRDRFPRVVGYPVLWLVVWLPVAGRWRGGPLSVVLVGITALVMTALPIGCFLA